MPIEYLECDVCGAYYNDEASLRMSKKLADQWRESCERWGEKARGIAPCPSIHCKGELVLKRRNMSS